MGKKNAIFQAEFKLRETDKYQCHTTGDRVPKSQVHSKIKKTKSKFKETSHLLELIIPPLFTVETILSEFLSLAADKTLTDIILIDK